MGIRTHYKRAMTSSIGMSLLASRRTTGRALTSAILLASCTAEPDHQNDHDDTPPIIVLDPSVVIGEIEGDPAYLFGDVRAVAVDDGGRIYVGDRIGASIRAYSASGKFIAQLAREGQGPGEIEGWPADMTFGPDGNLYVRDASRVIVFASSAAADVPDSVASTWRVPGYGNLTYSRSRVGDDHTYYYPNGSFRIGERPRFFYQLFRGRDVLGDTLEVPFHEGMEGQRTAFYRLGPSGGRMVHGLSRVPFAAVPTWDVSHAGTILSSDGLGAALVETGLAGDTLRIMRLDSAAPRLVPPRERADSLKALNARIDSLPVPLDQVINLGKDVADRRLPEILPAVVAVHIAAGGLVWVERWPPEGAGDSRVYDVFEATGEHRASVTLRAPLVAEPLPFFGRRAVVGVVRDAVTDVDRVVGFSLDELLRYMR